MQKELYTIKFEQINTQKNDFEAGKRVADIALDLGKAAMAFARIERIPRYADGERESDAEHSFMLALVAPEIVEALELPLDTKLVTQFAIVHDLVELKTGDVATFLFNESDQTQKEHDEHIALNELVRELPPHTATLLARYETQADPEARFVRYVDKLLPIVIDIIGAGERIMREDYNVTSSEALKQCHHDLHARIVEKFGHEFPTLDLAHQLLCELFEQCFIDLNQHLVENPSQKLV